MIALSKATFGFLRTGIEGPGYDRRNLKPGIVHIGLGNFHRAHQPCYLHRLMRQGLAQDWAIVEAAWARMCEGTRDDGSEISPNDPFRDELNDAAKEAKSSPAAWLEPRKLHGDLADRPRFADTFAHWLNLMSRDGMDAALHTYLKGA